MSAVAWIEATIRRALVEVEAERVRQDAKWGEQNHPNGTSAEFEFHRDMARADCADVVERAEPLVGRFGHGCITLTYYPSSQRVGVVQVGTNAVMDASELVAFMADAGLLELKETFT